MFLLALAACHSEYGFSDVVAPTPQVAPTVRADEVVPLPTLEAPEPPWTEAPAAGGASSVRVRPRSPAHLPDREDTFRFGLSEPVPTDILFVVDGSVSMERVVGSVRAGMEAISNEGIFPRDTRIAVTSMIPAAPDGVAVHPAVKHRSVAAIDPGFQRLVDQRSLDRFARAGRADHLPPVEHAGCSPWFSPTQSAGPVSCLVAHTHVAGETYAIEAGLVSLSQLLDAQPRLFRPGAAVNVVFVSDTHDPGIHPGSSAYDDLVRLRPDLDDLEARAAGGGPLAAFRLHAIAPASPCMEEAFPNVSYFDAARATGGLILDLCKAQPSDYVDMMRDMVRQGSRARQPVVTLSAEAADVAEVTLDGRPVGYAIAPGGRALLLDAELPARTESVRVRYSTPASRRVR